MSGSYTTETVPFDEKDSVEMSKMLSPAKRDFLIVLAMSVIFSLLLPFIPAKYPNSKAILDMMSYTKAAIGIFLIFNAVLVWLYYTTIHQIKKDLKQKMKVVLNTFITRKGTGKYRLKEYFYIEAAGLPPGLTRIPTEKETYPDIKTDDRVIIEYSLNSKKLLSLTLNTP